MSDWYSGAPDECSPCFWQGIRPADGIGFVKVADCRRHGDFAAWRHVRSRATYTFSRAQWHLMCLFRALVAGDVNRGEYIERRDYWRRIAMEAEFDIDNATRKMYAVR